MFGKAVIQNSNVWKSQISEFQCLEKPKFGIPMFGKPKARIPMFGKVKNENSNVWKSQIQNSTVWKSRNSEF